MTGVWILSVLLAISSYGVVWANDPIIREIDDDTEAGVTVLNVVEDFDLGLEFAPPVLRNLSFTFLSELGDYRNYFTLGEKTGDLVTKITIDRDEYCPGASQCALPVDIAVQPSQYFQILKAVIDISDRNDHTPEFAQDAVGYNILESTSTGVIAPVTTASDPDSPRYGVTKYKLEANTDLFSLNVRNYSGTYELVLHLNSELDRETEDSYTLKVLACDGGTPSLTGTLTLEIQVLDVNDNSPRFESNVNEVNIPENLTPGSSIVTIRATDDDIGQNGVIYYSFHDDTVSDINGIFSINRESGEITLEEMLDYETRASYSLIVVATDAGQDSLPTSTRVLVNIRDINDNRPVIDNNTLPVNRIIEIDENNAVSAFIAHISVIDLDHDQSGHVECFLNGDEGRFDIREVYEKEFKIIATGPLDYELQDTYVLQIRCQDYGIPPLNVEETLTVKVLDINDNAPEFSQDVYEVSLQENNHAPVILRSVTAYDVETGSDVRYSIESAAEDMFSIGRFSGEIRALRSFDREEQPVIRFEIIASDTGDPSLSSTATVVVELLDINDDKPTFTSPLLKMNVSENEPARTKVGRVVAMDRDAPPNNEFFYFLDHKLSAVDSFTIDPISGYVYTKRELDREDRGAYSLTVLVHSENFPNDEDTAVVEITILDVNDNAPIISFPDQPPHNSATVSNLAGSGYLVTRIIAHDYDLGQNGRIVYEILEGNEDGNFRVDYQTGEVLLSNDISDLENQVVPMKIMVRDLGDPSQMSIASLDIIINSSAPINENRGQGHTDPEAVKVERSRDSVAIIVGCICGALIVVLVIALLVVLILRRRKNGLGRNTPLYVAQPSSPIKEDILDFRSTTEVEQNHVNSMNSSGKDPSPTTTIPIKIGNGKIPRLDNQTNIEKEPIKTARSPPRSLQLSYSNTRGSGDEKDNDSGCADLSQGSSEETNIQPGAAVVQTKSYHPRAKNTDNSAEDKSSPVKDQDKKPNTTPRITIKQSILYNSKLQQPNHKQDLIRSRSAEPSITKPTSPSLTHFNLPPPKRSPSPLTISFPSSHPSFAEWLQTENKQLKTQGHKYNVGQTHKRSQSQNKIPKTVRFTEPERSPSMGRKTDEMSTSLDANVTCYRSPPPICIRSSDKSPKGDRNFLDLTNERAFSYGSLDRKRGQGYMNASCDAAQYPVARYPHDTYQNYTSPEDEDGSLV